MEAIYHQKIIFKHQKCGFTLPAELLKKGDHDVEYGFGAYSEMYAFGVELGKRSAIQFMMPSALE